MAPLQDSLPLLSLPPDTVLLPGVTVRIPIAGSLDLLPLFTHLLGAPRVPKVSDAWSAGIEGGAPVVVGCIPSFTPPAGFSRAHTVATESEARVARKAGSSGQPLDHPSKHDICGFGTVAIILGFEAGPLGRPVLAVQGIQRFRIVGITQIKPFMEATVIYHAGDGMLSDFLCVVSS